MNQSDQIFFGRTLYCPPGKGFGWLMEEMLPLRILKLRKSTKKKEKSADILYWLFFLKSQNKVKLLSNKICCSTGPKINLVA